MINNVLPGLAPGTPANACRGAAILLLDPADAVLAGLERLLAGESPRLRVFACTRSADAAFRLADSGTPDLIVADVFCEGCKGLESLVILRATGCPVLVLSCRDDSATRAAVLRLGARGLVSKLAPAGELLAAIDATLNLKPELGTST